jgi:hypothetical protein
VIPLRDSVPTSRPPVVTWALIAICLGVFMLQLAEDSGGTEITERLAMIPARVTDPERPIDIAVGYEQVPSRRGVKLVPVMRRAEAPPFSPWLTLLTCIFLHGGWLHCLGNMWFLWIFGDNVEDRLGRGRYLLFYLGCGVLASLAHFFTDPHSSTPVVGASGAIAGVMGAYMVLYPHSKVLTLLPLGIFLELIVVPAPLFLGIWFALQLFSGTLSLGSVATGGVAWWAHIGGFAVGAAVALLLRASDHLRPEPPTFTLSRRRVGRLF